MDLDRWLADFIRKGPDDEPQAAAAKPIRPQALIEAIVRVTLGQRSGRSKVQAA